VRAIIAPCSFTLRCSLSELIEQHRIHRVVAHGVDVTILVSHHQAWVHLGYFLGYQTKLWRIPAIAWIARTRLASAPVVFYAGLFVCIDIAYNVFEREVFARADNTQVSHRARRIARRRSLAVLAIFAIAMLVAFVARAWASV
jgi:uncharacterized membrane protein